MNKLQNFRRKAVTVGTGLAAATYGMAASAQTASLSDVAAKVEEAQTIGVGIAIAVTLMIFAFAAAKWVRRAK